MNTPDLWHFNKVRSLKGPLLLQFMETQDQKIKDCYNETMISH